MVNYSAFHYSEKARKVLEEIEHIKESIGQVYIFRGTVDTVADLPTGAKIGEVYDVLDSGTNYAWTGDRWDSLGAAFDLSEYAKKEYVDSTEQEIIKNYMDADTALQTQITGLSGVLDAEQDKITAIEGKIPTNASTSNMLSTASDLLNATQDVRSDFAEADSELQTQINGQATAIAGKQDKLTAGENITINGNVISATSELDGKITNCITEIPQDIKLELNNGTLTLRAGSKAYDGNGLFRTITNDTSTSWSHTGTGFVFVKNDGRIEVNSNGSETVSALPAPSTSYKIFYNTADGKCYYDYNNTQMVEISFPIATFTANNGITSIDQVFNGFGYIGSTVFVLPGVKGLIPNGRNEDGSLKNIEFTLSFVNTHTQTSTQDYANIYLSSNTLFASMIRTYDEKSNYIYNNSGVINSVADIGFLTRTNTSPYNITSFQPKTTFHALDYNDKSTIAGWGMPDLDNVVKIGLMNNNDTYTVPMDGYVCLTAETNKYATYSFDDQTIQIASYYFNSRNLYQVGKGTVIKKLDGTAVNATSIYNAFVPCKGVNQ
jgi:hypothetical protein